MLSSMHARIWLPTTLYAAYGNDLLEVRDHMMITGESVQSAACCCLRTSTSRMVHCTIDIQCARTGQVWAHAVLQHDGLTDPSLHTCLQWVLNLDCFVY